MKLLEVKPPFVAFSIPLRDYEKIKGFLPRATYKNEWSGNNPSMALCYEITHAITSWKTIQWLSNIKLTCKYIHKNIELLDEFVINEWSDIGNIYYSIYDLSTLFKVGFIKYPKPLFPTTKNELYPNLVKYAKKLLRMKLLTFEAIYSTALRFNISLPPTKRYSLRELNRSSKKALMFIIENKEELQALKGNELKERLKVGGKKRGNQKTKEKEANKKKIEQLVHTIKKPNGKPNITQIAKKLNISRKTVTRAIQGGLTLFVFWLPLSVHNLLYIKTEKTQYSNKVLSTNILNVAMLNIFNVSHRYHNANS